MIRLADRLLGIKRCVVCGKVAMREYYRDWADNRVCLHHEDAVCHCISCGRYCNAQAVYDFGHKRSLCAICEGDLINKKIVGGVVDYIRRAYIKGGLGEIRNWHLYVTEPKVMIHQWHNPDIKGYASRVGSDYTVYILKYLSRVSFASVLAHELLHIWQFNHRYSPEDWKCEGFCNMGSYYVLGLIGTEEAKVNMKAMEESQDPIYGEGFRRMKVAYDRGGWEEARKLLITK